MTEPAALEAAALRAGYRLTLLPSAATSTPLVARPPRQLPRIAARGAKPGADATARARRRCFAAGMEGAVFVSQGSRLRLRASRKRAAYRLIAAHYWLACRHGCCPRPRCASRAHATPRRGRILKCTPDTDTSQDEPPCRFHFCDFYCTLMLLWALTFAARLLLSSTTDIMALQMEQCPTCKPDEKTGTVELKKLRMHGQNGYAWRGTDDAPATAQLPAHSLYRLVHRLLDPPRCTKCDLEQAARCPVGRGHKRPAPGAPLLAPPSPAARGASSAVPSGEAPVGVSGRDGDTTGAAAPHAPLPRSQPTPPPLPPGVLPPLDPSAVTVTFIGPSVNGSYVVQVTVLYPNSSYAGSQHDAVQQRHQGVH